MIAEIREINSGQASIRSAQLSSLRFHRRHFIDKYQIRGPIKDKRGNLDNLTALLSGINPSKENKANGVNIVLTYKEYNRKSCHLEAELFHPRKESQPVHNGVKERNKGLNRKGHFDRVEIWRTLNSNRVKE